MPRKRDYSVPALALAAIVTGLSQLKGGFVSDLTWKNIINLRWVVSYKPNQEEKTPKTTPQKAIVKVRATLRAQPGKRGTPIQVILPGSHMRLIRQHPDGGWWLGEILQSNGIATGYTGWMHEDCLEIDAQ